MQKNVSPAQRVGLPLMNGDKERKSCAVMSGK